MTALSACFRTVAAFLALVVALAGFAGCRKAPAAQQQGPLPVNVVVAEEKEVTEWDEFTGLIDAVESVEIRARVSGYITEIRFKAGAIVNKDDLLFVIDPRPYQADLDRATANVEQAQAQMKLAEIEFKRTKGLRERNVVSPEEFDQKAATLQQAEASVRAATAAKDAADLNLKFTQVKSPITGRVSNERVTVGNLVTTGGGSDTLLTTVVSVDPLYVYMDADENIVLKYLKLRDEGKRKSAREQPIPVYIQLANETGFPHEGMIDFVDNRVDPTTGTLRARAVLKSWNELLSPGYFVRVRAPGGIPYRGVLVEDKVISSQQGVKYAYVVKADHTIERRNLETGTLFEGRRIVKSGLKDGEQVVSTRLQILQPGMAVQPIPEPKKETPSPAPAPAAADAKPAQAK